MIHNIWILCSVASIFFIIIHNPKAQNVNTQNKLFGSTRTAEETTNKITWIFITTFFLLTIFISSSSSNN
jgi:preprotein translocase subunit SecG